MFGIIKFKLCGSNHHFYEDKGGNSGPINISRNFTSEVKGVRIAPKDFMKGCDVGLAFSDITKLFRVTQLRRNIAYGDQELREQKK